MTKIKHIAGLSAAAILGIVLSGAAAQADGYPPFRGYSGYFGGPTTYFTHDSDVQQVTTIEGDGFGTRTYYRGGPFWTYQPTVHTRSVVRERRHARRAAVLRRRG